jgi:uncharacterized protein
MAQKTPIKAQAERAASQPFKAGRCSICKSPTDEALHPFCSPRCANVDLARWLGGGYVIADAGQDGDEDDDQIVRPAGGNANEDD